METIETATPAPVAQSSWWEDFVDVYIAPRQLFERRVDGRFMGALILLTVMMALIFYASQGPLGAAREAEFMRGLTIAQERAGQQLTAEQLQQQEQTMQQMRGLTSGTFGTLSVLFMIPIAVLVTGLVIWGVGKAFDSRATFGLAVTIATFAQFPKILHGFAAILQGLLIEPQAMNEVSLGPARFVDAAAVSPLLLALLARFDVSVLWGVALIAIGLSVVGQLPRSTAWIAAVIVWVLAFVPTVLGALAT